MGAVKAAGGNPDIRFLRVAASACTSLGRLVSRQLCPAKKRRVPPTIDSPPVGVWRAETQNAATKQCEEANLGDVRIAP